MIFRLSIFLCLVCRTATFADIGPTNYDGLSIVPAENTQISMREETVDIFVRNEGEQAPSRYLCDVKGEFVMENTSGQGIEIMVGFPVELYTGRLKLLDFSVKGDIYRFRVVANGQPVDSVSASVVNGSFFYNRPHDYLWFGWRQLFDPGTTRIQVEYTFVTTPVSGFNATRLGYSLYSGSFWKGTIGKARIVVHFPRRIGGEYISGLNPERCAIEGEKVVWEFEDFEPGMSDNIGLEFMPFELIDEIEAARRSFESRPDDLGAKTALAVAYLNTIRTFGKRIRLESDTWNGIDYTKEAEKLILEVLDKDPRDCYVWNLYLSHFFKIRKGGLGPSLIHPDDRLSVAQRKLIERASEHCPADSGIALWKALRDQAGPDFRDAVQCIEEAGDFITLWVNRPGDGTRVGWGIQPREREILYLMYQPVDTVKSETYIRSGVKREMRTISLRPRDWLVSDGLRESVREIVRWNQYLILFNGNKIRDYNEATGIYP